ncbi:hypothetical protein EKG38_10760 [Shewanella canadensis]|uniref:Transglycosylase SLT domain-containing protein n=1 Tax=Shewanella canadensis TaxID=271096 RepID=A0A3S0LM37_9GAMM|nr:transglycosylase SLT domain-containing protein [Shewanella canadensis]RTR38652.1 hypothetical protein EKG38_10760 [Shewanella canadensis]
MNKILLASLLAIGIFCATAEEQTNTETQFEAMMQEPAFQLYVRQQQDAWLAHQENTQIKFAAYRAELEKRWGFAEVNSSSKLVIYSQDQSAKLVVDHDNQAITVSLLKERESRDEADLKAFFIKAMKSELSDQMGSENAGPELTVAESLGLEPEKVDSLANDLVNNSTPVSEIEAIQSVVDDVERNLKKAKNEYAIVADSGLSEAGTLLTRQQSTIKEMEQQKARYVKLQQERIANPRSKSTTARKVPFQMSYWRAAQPYLANIQHYAKQQKLSDALILAIMETESNYNPLSRSDVPAHGLMQIVRHSAGADVYHRLHRKLGSPSEGELYKPEINIVYGANYLNILYYSYLSKVTSPESKLYCAIAAYNTGAGNVAKAFTGTKNFNRAATAINQMSPEQVLAILLKELPYAETQNYLKKVLSARDKYQQLAPTKHFI